MSFQNWFFSTKGKFVLFLLILVMSAINLFYQINIYSCSKINTELIKQNEEVTRQIAQFENREAYQNSQLYKEKQIRTEGYRYQGETIVDVSSIEQVPNNLLVDYIPDRQDESDSNLQKWIIFLGDVQLQSSSVSCV